MLAAALANFLLFVQFVVSEVAGLHVNVVVVRVFSTCVLLVTLKVFCCLNVVMVMVINGDGD